MEKLNDIIKKGEYKKPLQKREFYCRMSSTDFAERFISEATRTIHNSESSYIVDDDNKDAINQLFYYLIGSELFNGDLIKGILLIGSVGSGKTVMIESFVNIFNDASNKIALSLNAKDIVKVQAENGHGYLHRRPIFIDDIGKEQTTINTYGTVSKPMEDLINSRYKTAGLTFGTSNLKLEDMPYNKHTVDRMKQMFNILILPGKSRR